MFLLTVYFQDWIGNRNKTVLGRQYSYTKAINSRGMSSFNCYVHEKKGRKLSFFPQNPYAKITGIK